MSKVKHPGYSEDDRPQEYLSQLEERLERFYENDRKNPFFIRNLFVGFVLIVSLAILAFLYYHELKKPKPVAPVFTKVEGIKRLGELHLVKQHYESIVPIAKTKKKGKDRLQMLLVAPVEVSGYLDLSKLEIQMKPDSLVEIVLPEAEVSDVYLNFKKMEEFSTGGKFRIFGSVLERADHEKVYYDIAKAIEETKLKVRKKAIQNRILTETQNKAQIFIQNFIHSLGYRVNFRIQEEEVNATEALPADETEAG